MKTGVTVILVSGGKVIDVMSTDSGMVFHIVDLDTDQVTMFEFPETQYDDDVVEDILGYNPLPEEE